MSLKRFGDHFWPLFLEFCRSPSGHAMPPVASGHVPRMSQTQFNLLITELGLAAPSGPFDKHRCEVLFTTYTPFGSSKLQCEHCVNALHAACTAAGITPQDIQERIGSSFDQRQGARRARTFISLSSSGMPEDPRTAQSSHGIPPRPPTGNHADRPLAWQNSNDSENVEVFVKLSHLSPNHKYNTPPIHMARLTGSEPEDFLDLGMPPWMQPVLMRLATLEQAETERGYRMQNSNSGQAATSEQHVAISATSATSGHDAALAAQMVSLSSIVQAFESNLRELECQAFECNLGELEHQVGLQGAESHPSMKSAQPVDSTQVEKLAAKVQLLEKQLQVLEQHQAEAASGVATAVAALGVAQAAQQGRSAERESQAESTSAALAELREQVKELQPPASTSASALPAGSDPLPAMADRLATAEQAVAAQDKALTELSKQVASSQAAAALASTAAAAAGASTLSGSETYASKAELQRVESAMQQAHSELKGSVQLLQTDSASATQQLTSLEQTVSSIPTNPTTSAASSPSQPPEPGSVPAPVGSQADSLSDVVRRVAQLEQSVGPSLVQPGGAAQPSIAERLAVVETLVHSSDAKSEPGQKKVSDSGRVAAAAAAGAAATTQGSVDGVAAISAEVKKLTASIAQQQASVQQTLSQVQARVQTLEGRKSGAGVALASVGAAAIAGVADAQGGSVTSAEMQALAAKVDSISFTGAQERKKLQAHLTGVDQRMSTIAGSVADLDQQTQQQVEMLSAASLAASAVTRPSAAQAPPMASATPATAADLTRLSSKLDSLAANVAAEQAGLAAVHKKIEALEKNINKPDSSSRAAAGAAAAAAVSTSAAASATTATASAGEVQQLSVKVTNMEGLAASQKSQLDGLSRDLTTRLGTLEQRVASQGQATSAASAPAPVSSSSTDGSVDRAKLDDLAAQIAALSAPVATERASLGSYTDTSALQSQVKELEGKVAALQAGASAAAIAAGTAVAASARAAVVSGSSSADADILKQQVATLEARVAAIQEKPAGAAPGLAELQALKAQVAALEQTVVAVQSTASAATAAAAAAPAGGGPISEEVSRVKAQVLTLEKKVAKVEQSAALATEATAGATTAASAASSVAAGRSAGTGACSPPSEEAVQKVVEQSNAAAALLESLKKELQELKDASLRMSTTVAATQTQVDATQTQVKATQAQVNAAQAQVAATQTQVNATQAQVNAQASLSERLATAEGQVKGLAVAVQEASAQAKQAQQVQQMQQAAAPPVAGQETNASLGASVHSAVERTSTLEDSSKLDYVPRDEMMRALQALNKGLLEKIGALQEEMKKLGAGGVAVASASAASVPANGKLSVDETRKDIQVSFQTAVESVHSSLDRQANLHAHTHVHSGIAAASASSAPANGKHSVDETRKDIQELKRETEVLKAMLAKVHAVNGATQESHELQGRSSVTSSMDLPPGFNFTKESHELQGRASVTSSMDLPPGFNFTKIDEVAKALMLVAKQTNVRISKLEKSLVALTSAQAQLAEKNRLSPNQSIATAANNGVHYMNMNRGQSMSRGSSNSQPKRTSQVHPPPPPAVRARGREPFWEPRGENGNNLVSLDEVHQPLPPSLLTQRKSMQWGGAYTPQLHPKTSGDSNPKGSNDAAAVGANNMATKNSVLL
eukprot:gene8056-1288_t